MKRIIFSFLILSILNSCANSSEFESIKKENEQLKTELDNCMNGAEKLTAQIKNDFEEKKYLDVKEKIKEFKNRHPEKYKVEFDSILNVITEIEKEQDRIKNISNTGIWKVKYYVDRFGEPTDEGYITTLLNGYFSNSATNKSDLRVEFLITNKNDIDLMLFEYNGSNPVKSYGVESYSLSVKDSEGKIHDLRANNYSDRLSFQEKDSKILHDVLIKGGNIKFSIVETDNYVNSYDFEIKDSKYYDNAYRILTEPKKK